MAEDKDEIFREELKNVGEFQFNAKVAHVFDDMIRRSLPGYSTILQMLSVIADHFAQADTRIYDLGCSLGAATLALHRGADAKGVEFIAVDASEAMAERCRTALASLNGGQVQVICADVRDVPIENASVVVLNFTLQFVPVAERDALLIRIRRGLRPRGVLVLSEKLAFPDADQAELFAALHDGFRKQNGYSELEISQKRTALENVLFNESEAAHIARLKRAGFVRVESWFRCANFGSFLAFRT